jgi:hypothetical protein
MTPNPAVLRDAGAWLYRITHHQASRNDLAIRDEIRRTLTTTVSPHSPEHR